MANKFLDENGLLYFWQKIISKFMSKEEGKVLDEKINTINTNMGNLGGGDMMKSAYDTDGDGKVDNANNADKLGGELPSAFAPSSHTHTQNEISGLAETIGSVTEIANGKCKTQVFDTVDDMNTWLANSTNTDGLKIGDVFLIRAVDVPDYWWDGSAAKVLETTKVELNAISNTEIDTIVATS